MTAVMVKLKACFAVYTLYCQFHPWPFYCSLFTYFISCCWRTPDQRVIDSSFEGKLSCSEQCQWLVARKTKETNQLTCWLCSHKLSMLQQESTPSVAVTICCFKENQRNYDAHKWWSSKRCSSCPPVALKTTLEYAKMVAIPKRLCLRENLTTSM